MARYVDGFLLPVPKKNMAAYKRMATTASRVWRDHGALEYRECLGDDLVHKGLGITPFPRSARAKKGEVVVFARAV